MRLHPIVSAMIVAAVTAGCTAPAPPTVTPVPPVATAAPTATVTPAPDQAAVQVVVEGVSVRLLESFPIQVQAVVTGSMPDACTTITGAETRRNGKRFTVTLVATRPVDQMCAEVITPFEQIVRLDVMGLPAGPYAVTVHGVGADFVLPDANAGAPGDPVIATDVDYVLAVGGARIYSTPDATSPVIGMIAAGMTVRVTGKDPLGLWWRVVCPDDTVGDCWVSANPAVTQPTTPPG